MFGNVDIVKSFIPEVLRIRIARPDSSDPEPERDLGDEALLKKHLPPDFAYPLDRHPAMVSMGKNELRGLSFQWYPLTATAVKVVSGDVLVFALDLRVNSPTDGKAVLLNPTASDNARAGEWILIPPGIAYGILALDDSVLKLVCSKECNPDMSAEISPYASDIVWDHCLPDLYKTFADRRECSSYSNEKKAIKTLADWRRHPAHQCLCFNALQTEAGYPDGSSAARSSLDRNRPYLSCWWLRGFIVYTSGNENYQLCCVPKPPMGKWEKGVAPSVKQSLAIKNRIEDELNAGFENRCSSCHELRMRAWGDDNRLTQVVFTPSSRCNIACNYCCVHQQRDNGFENPEINCDCYDSLAFLKRSLAEGSIDENCYLELGGGEPTIIPGCDDFLNFAIDSLTGPIQIITNATVYSEAVARGLALGRITVLTSPDAGNRETFQIIKRRDLFDKVMENIAKYGRYNPGKVKVKYILLPENKDAGNQDAFLERMKQCRIQNLVLTRNFINTADLDDGILQAAGRFRYHAERMGFSVDVFYFQFDGMYRNINCRPIIEQAYRAEFPEHVARIPDMASGEGNGGILHVIRANHGGVWMDGWAYDREHGRHADEIAVFWDGSPLFSGICRRIAAEIAHSVNTVFSFNSSDQALADKILVNCDGLTAYARFGGEWLKLNSVSDSSGV